MIDSPEISRTAILEVAQNVQAIAGQTVVIKMGGELIANDDQLGQMAEDAEILADYGVSTVIVHGGSPFIKSGFAKNGVETKMVDGKRVTPQEHVHIVADALNEANHRLTGAINDRAEGLAVGYPEGILVGRILDEDDFGSVDPDSVSISINQDTSHGVLALEDVLGSGKVAVVSCIGKLLADQSVVLAANGKIKTPENGVPAININGDIAATAIARIMNAYKFISLMAEGAVLDKNKQRISRIQGIAHAEELIKNGTIYDGMVPKVEEALRILSDVGSVAISSPANLAHELFTNNGAGTLITRQ